MAKDSTVEGPRAYQLKLSLDDAKPPIWRRVVVEGEETLAGLHDIIQVAMGWEDCHLHEFTINGKSYGSMDGEGPSEALDEESFTLEEVLGGKGSRFSYVYDFGDDWRVTIRVEKVMAVDPEMEYPVCVAGARNGPPEDSGGVCGYLMKLEALANPDDPEHDEVAAWMGADWDPEQFDLETINAGMDPGIYDEGVSDDDFFALDEEEQDALLKTMLDEDPFLEERVARLHAKIAAVHGLNSPEAVHAFVESTDPDVLKDFAMEHMASDPVEAAFEFGLLALEADTRLEGQQFAERALELDARNVDGRIAKAHYLLADEKFPEGIALLREAVAVAEENLGSGFLDAHRGELSDLIETRSYVRARMSLARALRFDGQVNEATQHLAALLDLDVEDYIGARFGLVGMLLQTGRPEEARTVIEQYGTGPDPDPVLTWARVLERYQSGDLEGAEAVLEMAFEVNPLAATLLLDTGIAEDVDEDLEEGVAALLCMEHFGEAWENTEGALDWLATFVYEDGDRG